MSSARPLIARLLISLTLVTAAASSARAASFFDPAHRYRTLATEHFSIHFHQGEDRLARRLAVIAEDVWRKIQTPLGAQPPPHTEIVLADQTDLSNGFATPVPYNTVMVTAVWPAGSEFIGNTDDWLRLVFTHEFTHIVHLDRSEGWARFVRGIFGRVPVAFPNLLLPQWQIEGLATYQESLTGEGRLHAGDFRSVLDEAARARRFEPLGRLNGGLTDWPGGLGAYAYGAGFHAYLAERYGDASLARLAGASARRVPFTASRVFERIYGRSLGDLWRDYEASVTNRVRGSAPSDSPLILDPPALSAANGSKDERQPRRLTHHGFVVGGPRFDRSACDGCPAPVIYSVRTPHEFPSLYELPGDRRAPRRLARRYLGSTSAASKQTIVFDQQELRRNTGLYSDLYALDRATGRVRPLTVEARLLDPDLAPDSSTLVAVQDAPGRRDLVLVEGALEGRPIVIPLASEPDTQFNAPRWSPDGRTVAVERHRRGRLSEIAIVDVETRTSRTIASDARARFVTPAWRPDGRAIVAAADFGEDLFDQKAPGGPFNLYEIEVDRLPAIEWRPLTQGSAGATWPDVSADGTSIVFVGYTVDGFDLFEMPYPAAAPRASASLPPATAPDDAGELEAAAPSEAATKYNPVRTLRPTSWSPVVEWDRQQLRVGFATGGVDVLGYHAYTGWATWRASAPSGVDTPAADTPDWQVSYSYGRWRPTVWLSASARTSFFAGPADAAGTPMTATLREREFEAGLVFPVRHVKVSHRTVSALVRGVDELALPAGVVSSNRTAWRGGWSINSSHRYGYSISPEDGGAFGVTADVSRAAFGSSADTTAITADGRLYLSPFVRHQVLAVRLAGGASTGDPTVRKTFHLGGAQPNAETVDFGRQAISLLRGFGADTFAGSHVALMNVDYRWPVARPQRGYGTWPLFLHTVHAALFTDVGHAWTREFRARDVKASFGGELSLDVVAGYSFPFTLTAGAAWGRDGRTVAKGGVAYVRVGRAF